MLSLPCRAERGVQRPVEPFTLTREREDAGKLLSAVSPAHRLPAPCNGLQSKKMCTRSPDSTLPTAPR